MARGSLLLAWQVSQKHCLIIGAGDVALSRVNHMLRALAKITVVTGSGHIHPSLVQYEKDGKLHKMIRREFVMDDLKMYEKPETFNNGEKMLDFDGMNPEDLTKLQALINDAVFNETFAVVCCCIDDYQLSTHIYYQCKYLRIPVNIADKPPMCDFYFGSMYNRDNLQIMISTNGMSPRLLKKIKDTVAQQFDNIDLNKAVENLGVLRARLREKLVPLDDLQSIDVRMEWIKKVTDYFTVEQWSLLEVNDDLADKLLKHFPGLPPADYEIYAK